MKTKLTNNKNIFKIPKIILISGKVLQFISNKLATKFAAKIFSTPLKFNIPERELMMRKSAKKESIEIKSIQKKVMVYSYGYSRKKVLLVHGWSGRGTQLYQLADKILENQMMVISFDAPAHGLSSGKITIMNEFVKTILELESKYGPFHAVIGHSFGGMSLLNAISSGLKTEKLVTIGTDDAVTEILMNFVKKMELKPIIAEDLAKFHLKKYDIDIDTYSSHHNAKKVEIPTLVIHDSEDKYVPVSSAFSIRQNLKNGELLITNGLGHHKIFKDNKIMQRIVNFIK
ncbi:MAG: alpha/beta hydrolase [Flavobacteriaceae bacterium]|nr:alpha/beta hydrolase [Flavobacteriaceae bacterium]